MIAEYNGSTVLKRYVHGPGLDEPLVEYQGTGTSNRTFLIADERGSIVAGTDSSGARTYINRYDEYGKPQSGNQGRFQYTGQVWLSGAGIYHYKARVYDPELGRFLQTDPIGYAAGMNLYAYVRNDPMNFNDPYGLCPECDNFFRFFRRPGRGGDIPTVPEQYDQEGVPTSPGANQFRSAYNQRVSAAGAPDVQLQGDALTFTQSRETSALDIHLSIQIPFVGGVEFGIVTFTYTHNALGQLLDRTVPGAPTHLSNGETVSHSYTYNAFGSVLTATHDGETLTYDYDAIGRVEWQKHNGVLPVSYDYDAANNLTKLTYPDGWEVVFEYDDHNRIEFAKNGARTLASVSYDALSRRESVSYANGTSVKYGYSDRGDLECHDWNFSGAAPASCNSGAPELAWDFTYNGVGQILTRTISDSAYVWSPTAAVTDTYTVNGLNQYTAAKGATLSYNGNGNLTTDHHGRTFTYDAENVLRSVSGLTGGTATYRYGADGSRRQKTHNGTTTTFYYMGGLGYLDQGDTAFAADQEIAEYSGSGTLLRRFVRLPGSVDEAFLMIDESGGSPVETWAHTNRLGSVVATTNSTGTVQDKYRYSPYGQPGSEGPTGFPFRFTGQRLDAETGLYYYKARYYDPETGRFLQTDPIGYEDQMNLYAYAGNDPANLIDPSGLAKCAKSLNDRQCEKALDDADAARDSAESLAEGLSDLANRVKSGDLTEADQNALDLVSETVGEKFTTARGLKRLSRTFSRIAKKIGARGEGAILRHGGNSGPLGGKKSIPPAYVLSSFGGRSIYFNDVYFDSRKDFREHTMLHEAAHLSGAWRDHYTRSGVENNRLNNKNFPGFGAQRNADTYACMAYPTICRF